MNLKEIQKHLGVAADGILGPRTAAALAAARYDVVVDAGHTGDRAREYPADWPRGTWDTPAGRRILRRLNTTPAAQDSVEHLLNTAMAQHTAAALARAGLRVLVYDDPALGNTAEYKLAARIANAAAPRVFLSLHCNASRGVENYGTNTACGSITYYRVANPAAGKALAADLTTALLRLRAACSAPGNRADRTAPGAAYHVLNATPAATASVLCEAGFYDHPADLEFLAANLREIGGSLAAAITARITA